MDLTDEITYRDFALNTVATSPVDGVGEDGIVGCVVDSVDMSDLDVVQFTEKRAQSDGMDVGDVFNGARRIRMAGTLYARTRAGLFDSLQQLRAACSATLAFREDPDAKGYQPMYFSVPTARTDDYPAEKINMRILVMPRAFQEIIQRDQTGGVPADALAIPWQATFIARDPRKMAATQTDTSFSATTEVSATAAASTDLVAKTAHGLVAGDRVYFTALVGGSGLSLGIGYYVISSGLTTDAFKVSLTSGGSAVNIATDYTSGTKYVKVVTLSGTFSNRGDYHAQLNMLLAVGAQPGTIVVSAGGSNFTITVPASTGDRIIRLKGEEKIITVEENDEEELRYALLTFEGSSTYPLVPAGSSPYSITFIGVTVQSDSHMWFWESFA